MAKIPAVARVAVEEVVESHNIRRVGEDRRRIDRHESSDGSSDVEGTDDIIGMKLLTILTLHSIIMMMTNVDRYTEGYTRLIRERNRFEEGQKGLWF